MYFNLKNKEDIVSSCLGMLSYGPVLIPWGGAGCFEKFMALIPLVFTVERISEYCKKQKQL